VGLLFFALGQALSISVIVSGRFLKQRKHYMFSFIMACLACAAFPFGTILGVFTHRPGAAFGEGDLRPGVALQVAQRLLTTVIVCRAGLPHDDLSDSTSGMWVKAMRVGAASLERCFCGNSLVYSV
jgi:hypothetical protein